MQQSVGQFIIANFTLSVFVSVIVYKIFSIFLDELITPCVYMFIDPESDLAGKKIKIGNYMIEYGKSFRDFIVLVLILLLTYCLFSTK
jgi:hypothetical protein|tara:strand:- start:2633 stop:2896 length:264 start_codon:yes stop_codon:yes gene_type:complete